MTTSTKTLVARLAKEIQEKLSGADAAPLLTFAESMYRSVAASDLESRSTVDLYGAMLCHWNFFKHRSANEVKIRAYNPNFEQDGWQSSHTIIEVSGPDQPFVSDSVRMALSANNLTIHLVMQTPALNVKRSKDHIDSVDFKETDKPEASLYIEIDKQSDPEVLEKIERDLTEVFSEVSDAVTDWRAMVDKVHEVIKELEDSPCELDRTEKKECVDFLHWMSENHFTLLAYQERENVQNGEQVISKVIPKSRLGIKKNTTKPSEVVITDLPAKAQEIAFSYFPIITGKTSTRSRVHRPAFCDFISVKRFDKSGKVIGEHRFIGLFTSTAYHSPPKNIPIIKRKVELIMKKSGFLPTSHEGKTLLNILVTFPRDDLFHATVDDIKEIALGIMYLQERQQTRFFMRADTYGRYYSCLVFVPRDKFDSELREEFQKIIMDELKGYECSFQTTFSESVLARVHFVVQTNERDLSVNIADVEARLEAAAVQWIDELKASLIERYGEEKGNHLFTKYKNAFPPAYQSDFLCRNTVYDIAHMEKLKSDQSLEMSFYQPLEEENLRFRIFQPGSPIPLSEIIPLLENMGLRVINEKPYHVKLQNNRDIWINDFSMRHEMGSDFDVHEVKELFQDAFYSTWHGVNENDGFNRLVLSAQIPWRDISLLRAYSRYMWQIGFTFSQNYIENALANQPRIAKLIVEIFHVRFNPDENGSRESKTNTLTEEIKAMLDEVTNLDEDRILRRYVDLINATIRTNFYQKDAPSIALKFNPRAVPGIPQPAPKFEIFVHSPRVEGVHLRMGAVARGGLRLSDRAEDFRTEVLGLVKAQQVKNAVIVPFGAKGGFVPRHLPVEQGREAVQAEAIECYKIFIRSLIKLTDNIVDGEIVPPENVVRYDGDDPYFVVAADKGTATFSDIANQISIEHNFWLKDAFASGGSAGYDHKKMGITARGAWESVKLHFREMGHDTQSDDFTVVGIGDMSGDVFGNGMLLSKHIRLVAAFNHMHIFVDPNPDSEISFKERERLFNLPRSTWDDYNKELISTGGGVFSRAAKSIPISAEMKNRFGINSDRLEPNELIGFILKAEADLLWNGGIGTYVKATSERNADVGDRANDAIRINGCQLRAKVIGEGGNLGMTQLGRVEYAQNGGRVNTDAIDNSAGVDCSDHEVNIKILLDDVVSSGDLTEKQRNELLAEMTDEVAELVLKNNRAQTQAISIAQSNAKDTLEMMFRMVQNLEKKGALDPEIEFLPNKDEIEKRKQLGLGLTRPEIAVLLAYSKNYLFDNLLSSDLLDEEDVQEFATRVFPRKLLNNYGDKVANHRLRREIIATQLANLINNEMGSSFVDRLRQETGADAPNIIRAYLVVREVFSIQELKDDVVRANINNEAEMQIIMELNRLTRRCTRWFLRNHRSGIGIQEKINHYKSKVNEVSENLRAHIGGTTQQLIEKNAKKYIEAGLDDVTAYKVAGSFGMYSALDIVEAATENDIPVKMLVSAYFMVGSKLKLGWFREQIKNYPVRHHWDSLARAAYRDDIDCQQRKIALGVLKICGLEMDPKQTIEAWHKSQSGLIDHWDAMMQEMTLQSDREFTMFAVAMRELLDIAQAMDIESNKS